MLNTPYRNALHLAAVRICKTIFLPSLVIFLSAQGASAQTVVRTVGLFGCNFSSLQGAVNFMETQPAEATKIIRIDNSFVQTSQSVTIEDISLTLAGGLDGCGSTIEGPIPTELRGLDTAPVLHIVSTGTAQEVVLRNLILSDGGGDEGGGLLAEGAVTIRIHDTLFTNNSAENGGAVALGGGAMLEIERVTMESNTATLNGGAINCRTGGIVGRGLNTFSLNSAGLRGGALSVSDQCPSTFYGAHTFQENVSVGGGAIYNFADMAFLPGPGGRPVFFGNRADLEPGLLGDAQRGGAIYHLRNHLILQNARFEYNAVGSVEGDRLSCGGAIAFNRGFPWSAQIESTRTICAGGPCSVFKGNQGDHGAALCADGVGSISMHGVLLEQQIGTLGELADSVMLFGDGATSSRVDAVLENVLIVDNSANIALLKHGVRGDLTVAYSTISGNRDLSQMIGVLNSDQNRSGISEPGQIHLASSIFWEDPATDLLVAADLEVSTECLLLSETQTVPLPTHWLNIDPRFQDPVFRDFSLAADSPAIDFCSVGTYPVPERDIDQGVRGLDDPSTPNAGPGRTYDIGADEFGTDGFLFDDGFESGTASAWSRIVG